MVNSSSLSAFDDFRSSCCYESVATEILYDWDLAPIPNFIQKIIHRRESNQRRIPFEQGTGTWLNVSATIRVMSQLRQEDNTLMPLRYGQSIDLSRRKVNARKSLHSPRFHLIFISRQT